MELISHVVGFIYADDCKIVQSDDDIETTQSQMQLLVSEWGDLIRITGGYLSPNNAHGT